MASELVLHAAKRLGDFGPPRPPLPHLFKQVLQVDVILIDSNLIVVQLARRRHARSLQHDPLALQQDPMRMGGLQAAEGGVEVLVALVVVLARVDKVVVTLQVVLVGELGAEGNQDVYKVVIDAWERLRLGHWAVLESGRGGRM